MSSAESQGGDTSWQPENKCPQLRTKSLFVPSSASLNQLTPLPLPLGKS